MGRRISDGYSVRVVVPPSTTIEQGQFVQIGDVLGLAAQSVTTDATSTAPLVLLTDVAEYETSQIDNAQTYNVGNSLFWDATNRRFTTVATGNRFAGIVTSAKDANGVIQFVFAGLAAR